LNCGGSPRPGLPCNRVYAPASGRAGESPIVHLARAGFDRPASRRMQAEGALSWFESQCHVLAAENRRLCEENAALRKLIGSSIPAGSWGCSAARTAVASAPSGAPIAVPGGVSSDIPTHTVPSQNSQCQPPQQHRGATGNRESGARTQTIPSPCCCSSEGDLPLKHEDDGVCCPALACPAVLIPSNAAEANR